MTRSPLNRRRHRSGMVLIIAMVVSFALAGTVLVLCRSMRTEVLASANLSAAVQAASVERGAEQYVLGMLATEGENVRDLGEEQFSAVPVGDGYFWVLRPDYDDSQLPAFGLVEESIKVNLNSASYDQLLRLPGMTEDVASAIMEWKDTDETVERSGPESSYYLSLPEPYYSKNSNFETVEELLMLRGVTHQMLYGDGTAPPLGQRSGTVGSASNFVSDPQIARGMYDLLTIYTVEPNTSAAGETRVNLRDRSSDGRDKLKNLLKKRLNSARANEIVNTLGRDRPNDIFDFYLKVKLTPDEFDKIADDLTITSDRTLRGKINVNTAPRATLATLTGLDSSDVDKLLAQRPSIGSVDPAALSWVVQALGEKARGLGTQITTKSLQYSADILAVTGNGRAFKRCRIVIDMRSGTPQIIYRRDLSDRGWPMDKQVLASLRSGQAQSQGNLAMNTMSRGGI